jgi:hypothetical protein
MWTSSTIFEELFRSLHARRRPEDIAALIRTELDRELSADQRALLDRAARGSLARKVFGYTSMPQTFARPAGLGPQVERARALFATMPAAAVTADDPDQVRALIAALGAEIGKSAGASDFQRDRLNGELRSHAGVPDSRRRYNRKFRLLRRMERKLAALGVQLEHHDLTMIGKSGLATRISFESFVHWRDAACFIAYLVARKNLRSEFTIWGQTQAYDEIAAMLLARCPGGWLQIAHVHPVREVLVQLTEEEKMSLYGEWLTVMYRLAEALSAVWQRSRFNLETMTVKKGDDSTTWNQLAGAWNVAREAWMQLTYALGLESVLDQACPGKVMRLIAGDLAYMHAMVGHGTEGNTQVWAQLPMPWDVLRGQGGRCDRRTIAAACARAGVDPRKSGWIAARPPLVPVAFTPTPELVHGVVVANPYLAGFLRRAGWFSGKGAREVAGATVTTAIVAATTGEVSEPN